MTDLNFSRRAALDRILLIKLGVKMGHSMQVFSQLQQSDVFAAGAAVVKSAAISGPALQDGSPRTPEQEKKPEHNGDSVAQRLPGS